MTDFEWIDGKPGSLEIKVKLSTLTKLTERARNSEALLRKIAKTDPLTGLPRAALLEIVTKAREFLGDDDA